ncbi:MAG TPA: S8 family peptidase [Clostridiales bacterium]|nr:S8 family peptidase [Clostridiales bacterium]
MSPEERYKITSNDFVDFIINYGGNESILNQFPGASIQIMNVQYAVAYLPASQLTVNTISEYGYSIIPAYFGLNSTRSLEASGVNRVRLVPTLNLRGQGTIVGIIDTGIDYTNPIFRNADGTTRIISIWDQSIESDNYPQDFLYGTQYLAEEINRALQSEAPYEIVPSRDEIGHGTMLAGVAAGGVVPEQNFSGVAPDAEIIVVKLKQIKEILRNFYVIPPDVPCYQENDIMWAVQYVVDMARGQGKPVSICLGIGNSLGSHSGSGNLGSLLAVGGSFPGVVINIAAGNEGTARRHFFSEIDPTIGYTTMELNVGENESGFMMELWGRIPNIYSVDILSPTGEYVPRITPTMRVNREISFIFEQTQITLDYQLVEGMTGQQVIVFRFRRPTAGIWRFQVYGRGDLRGAFHVWLPMTGFISDTTYFMQSNPYTTVTVPGNVQEPLTVTAYNPDNNNLYTNASRGFTSNDIIKPELAAPGVNITAPTLEQGFTDVTGTSIAAAHTAGIAAMVLEWGIVRGNYPGMNTTEVKKFLIRGAKRNPNLSYPNQDWGYGIMDVYNFFVELRAESPRI